jgi:hypothetical protein
MWKTSREQYTILDSLVGHLEELALWWLYWLWQDGWALVEVLMGWLQKLHCCGDHECYHNKQNLADSWMCGLSEQMDARRMLP